MTHYRAIVIGGGHAGIEAVNILNTLSVHTALITPDKNKIGYASCNPSIGGIGKSHLVYELDALGGIMPLASDYAGIHYKLLNRSKGPAVWSLRAQIDMGMYTAFMRNAVESMKHVHVIEDMAEGLIIENGKLKGVATKEHAEVFSETVIITAGTFLSGMMFTGSEAEPGGRYNEGPSLGLSLSIREHGMKTGRLKTGTSPRIIRQSIDFTSMETQESEEHTGTFSINAGDEAQGKAVCHITRTNTETHSIIRENLDKSALFSGMITGKGPRYCPSIEDKIVRFSRESHTVFIEPTGLDSDIYYLNGLSTSMPADIQERIIRSVKGLENAEIAVPGYAIEYDFIYPEQLNRTLESRAVENLYFAGQVNGTSGYEEAAAQGFCAGLNAGMKIRQGIKIEFSRTDSYTGVLIEDLMHRDMSEPYRLFTSRAENRLMLRQDNAFIRMKPYAESSKIGLKKEYEALEKETESLTALCMKSGKPSGVFAEFTNPSKTFAEFSQLTGSYSYRARLFVYSHMKYSGYIKRSERIIEKISKFADTEISHDELSSLNIISKEARNLIIKHKPQRISDLYGIIDPTDIENIIIYIQRNRK